MNGAASPEVWGAILLLVITMTILIFDTYAAFSAGAVDSVSTVLYHWAQRWPIIPLVVGILIGHLFFPTRPAPPPPNPVSAAPP